MEDDETLNLIKIQNNSEIPLEPSNTANHYDSHPGKLHPM
jgi:hypothetical protein